MAYLLSCLSLLLTVAVVSCAPTVQVSRSTFVGVDSKAYETEKPYHVYYGIPFAEPPVGRLRFRPPVAYDNTKEPRTFDDQKFRPGCIQPLGLFPNFTVDEDCLYLNIFTPDVGQNNAFDTISLKKVIFYVHGGGYRFGGASVLPAANLVTDYDVIVVTTQYRLGILGFLSNGDEELPGNFGLLDLVAALQWVKDNIRSFGGDPTDVTVSGCSAGASSLSLLSLSPLGKGLFTKLILESGTALSPWAIDKDYKRRFYTLAQKANCLPTSDDKRSTSVDCHSDIVDCLRDIDVFQLDNYMVEENMPRPQEAVSMGGTVFFAPVVDGVVIPKHPSELLNDADHLAEVGALDRKYMVGVSNNEGMLQVLNNLWRLRVAPPEAFLNPDSEGAKAIIRHNLQYVFSFPISEESLHTASFMYYYPRDEDGSSSLQSTVDFLSDIDYVVPAVNFTRALTAVSKEVKVYLYVFDFYPTLADPQFPLQGTDHCMPTAYLFDGDNSIFNLFSYANIPTKTRNCLSNAERGMMVNMAKEGDPSQPDGVQWPAYTRKNEHYMAISETLEVRQHMYARRVAMWLDLLPRLLSPKSV